MIECKLVSFTNRKSHMDFRLVPKLVILNDLKVTRTEMAKDQTGYTQYENKTVCVYIVFLSLW